jgi:hypothetical protein
MIADWRRAKVGGATGGSGELLVEPVRWRLFQ